MNAQLEEMVATQIEGRGIKDSRVLNAMRTVDRALFVPEHLKHAAYEDSPLPIGSGQTISQPYIVALMTELCELNSSVKVLEIGTGCGYQTAVLSLLAAKIYSIERIAALAQTVPSTAQKYFEGKAEFLYGDGFAGWPVQAPYDVIIITAAPHKIPEKLFDQLREGGRLVSPEGEGIQQLVRARKTPSGIIRENACYVRFVPMLRGTE